MSGVVHALDDLIFASCVVLEVCLLARLSRGESRGRYGFLLLYVLYVLLVMDVLLFAVRHVLPAVYPISYWSFQLISILLRFCVVWEIYRQIFPGGALRKNVSPRWLVTLCFWLGAACVGALSYLWNYSNTLSFYPAFECSLSFVQATIVLGVLLLAAQRGVRLGRNTWGVAIGFGIYLSVNLLNFAILEMSPSLYPFFRSFVPLSFVTLLAIWTWALWSYAPIPRPEAADAGADSETLEWWARRWTETSREARKVVNP